MKRIIQKLWMSWVLISVTLAAGAGPASVLAQNGFSDYMIVVAPDAIAAEMTAAVELQTFIRRLSGAELPIIRQERFDGHAIYVGQSVWIGHALNIDFRELKPDEMILRRQGDDLFLSGARPRGTLYAVYTLLEDVFGVRFWTETVTDCPSHSILEMPERLAIRYAPPFIVREGSYCLNDPVFAARRKLNGHWLEIPEEYGGHETILGFCHTFDVILPPEEYFDSHPEWFAEIDGRRRKDNSQLCLTNPEMRREFAQKAIAWIGDNPNAKIVAISQDDGGGQCCCATCEKALSAAAGRGSEVLLDFVNEIAAKIKAVYPDILIETLAYDWTRAAPEQVRPADNVVIRLCASSTPDTSAARPINSSSPYNASFRADVKAWSANAAQLAGWLYVANFYNFLLPYPNLRYIDEDLRFLRDHQAKLIFLNADNGSLRLGDFVEMRIWICSKLLWNPDLSVETLRREFIEGYYGPAAPNLLEYWSLLETELASEPPPPLTFTMDNTDKWLSFPTLFKAYLLMRQARKQVAGMAPYEKRVELAALPVQFALLLRPEINDPAMRTADSPEIDPAVLLKETLHSAHQFGTYNFSEHEPFSQLERNLKLSYAPEDEVLPERIPAAFRQCPPESLFFLPSAEGTLGAKDLELFVINDPESVTGRVVRMLARNNGWFLQQPIRSPVPYRCRAYAGLRVVARPGADETAEAVTFGLYDPAGRQGKAITCTVAELAGDDYVYREIGEFVFQGGEYFYFAAAVNPQLESILVDQIVLVREEERDAKKSN
ncbi:DUF4838 domain-containing protein [Victivallis sp. Marseille-Q1083]|uniref:DUF4838 domain-containing protein n=1 Tax=Victivallis sp. Marseille-Q1083 TaxID=2717288 RepID=UPI00158BC164|nr:DUF4838 domain-containing protein [Victivallis sp. Marseille-Q1083]